MHFFAVLMICALPESPRWLMVIDRLGEAEAVIRKACRFAHQQIIGLGFRVEEGTEREYLMNKNQKSLK